MATSTYYYNDITMKDKNVAALLALFLGVFGVHRFYLGDTGRGILHLFFMWAVPIVALIAIIDMIVFFTMDQEQFDFKYNRAYMRTDYIDRDTDFQRKRKRRRSRNDDIIEEEIETRRTRRTRTTRAKRRDRPTTIREERRQAKANRPIKNPHKESGKEKYKDFDYKGAIEDFQKALEINPKDIAVHFNLACAYSLTEEKEDAFYHLGEAVENGFNDYKRIKKHDALAYLRIQDEFELFERNGFKLNRAEEKPKEAENQEPDLLEQLKRLGELRERGLLTDDEFQVQKKKLLG